MRSPPFELIHLSIQLTLKQSDSELRVLLKKNTELRVQETGRENTSPCIKSQDFHQQTIWKKNCGILEVSHLGPWLLFRQNHQKRSDQSNLQRKEKRMRIKQEEKKRSDKEIIRITPPPPEHKNLDEVALKQPLLFHGISDARSHQYFDEKTEAAFLEFSNKNVPLEQVTTIINIRKSKGEEKDVALNAARKAKKRRDLLAAVQKRRAEVAMESPIKYNRDLMLKRVAHILFEHIKEGEEVRVVPSEAALLFRESDFATAKWTIKQASGLQFSAPTFIYHLQRLTGDGEGPTSEEEVFKYLWEVFSKMRLALECSIICLIYIERLMNCAQLELRSLNWRPIVYIALLLASKFWQDINFWNIDFAERFPSRFPLRSINELENRFFALCNYNLFISFPYYLKYYFAINAARPLSVPRDTEPSENNWSEIHAGFRPSSLASLAPSLPILD